MPRCCTKLRARLRETTTLCDSHQLIGTETSNSRPVVRRRRRSSSSSCCCCCCCCCCGCCWRCGCGLEIRAPSRCISIGGERARATEDCGFSRSDLEPQTVELGIMRSDDHSHKPTASPQELAALTEALNRRSKPEPPKPRHVAAYLAAGTMPQWRLTFCFLGKGHQETGEANPRRFQARIQGALGVVLSGVCRHKRGPIKKQVQEGHVASGLLYCCAVLFKKKGGSRGRAPLRRPLPNLS